MDLLGTFDRGVWLFRRINTQPFLQLRILATPVLPKQKKRFGSLFSSFRPLAILGDPGAVSRVGKMFVVKVYCKIEKSR